MQHSVIIIKTRRAAAAVAKEAVEEEEDLSLRFNLKVLLGTTTAEARKKNIKLKYSSIMFIVFRMVRASLQSGTAARTQELDGTFAQEHHEASSTAIYLRFPVKFDNLSMNITIHDVLNLITIFKQECVIFY